MHTGIVIASHTFVYENLVERCISDELLSGWPVVVQQRQGEFLQITTHYGYSGWLDASDVRDILPEEYAWWNPWEHTKGRLAILCRGITDILREPKVQAEILSTLFMGSTVIPIGEPENGWQKVKTAGEICGYVPSISLLPSECMINTQLSFGNCRCPLNSSQDKDGLLAQRRLRTAIIDYAKSYLGVQYRWGGKTHGGIDCSGLTFMSYYMCGFLIYRDAAIVDGYPVREIPFSQVQPADLLYFPGHIALYLGDGKFIHSTGNLASFGCVINSLNPQDSDYRKDLADSLYAVGSVFC